MRKGLLLLVVFGTLLLSGCVVPTPGMHLDLPGSYLPFSLIGLARRKKSVLGPILVNVLLGWTVIGWIVALIWALTVDE